jgi:putative transposase
MAIHRWSSAAAHVEGRDDILLKAGPLLEMIGDWREYLSKESSDKEVAAFERHERTGHPPKKYVLYVKGTLITRVARVII